MQTVIYRPLALIEYIRTKLIWKDSDIKFNSIELDKPITLRRYLIVSDTDHVAIETITRRVTTKDTTTYIVGLAIVDKKEQTTPTAGYVIPDVSITKGEFAELKAQVNFVTANAITCDKCGTTIFSRSRHDYNECSCGAIAIDGGFEYLRTIITDGQTPEVKKLVLYNVTKCDLYYDWNYYSNNYGKINKQQENTTMYAVHTTATTNAVPQVATPKKNTVACNNCTCNDEPDNSGLCMSITEASKYLGLDNYQVRKILSSNHIRHFKIGSTTKLVRASVENFKKYMTKLKESEQYKTVSEASKILGLSEYAIRKLVKEHKIDSYKPRHTLKVNIDNVINYLFSISVGTDIKPIEA